MSIEPQDWQNAALRIAALANEAANAFEAIGYVDTANKLRQGVDYEIRAARAGDGDAQ